MNKLIQRSNLYSLILSSTLCLFALLSSPDCVYADCNCVVELSNYANGEITIKKVKTAKAIDVVDGFVVAGIYKTQWKGTRKIRKEKSSKFSFSVDFCNSRYLFRLVRKDGKQCTRAGERGYRCGTSSNPLNLSCSPLDWR